MPVTDYADDTISIEFCRTLSTLIVVTPSIEILNYLGQFFLILICCVLPKKYLSCCFRAHIAPKRPIKRGKAGVATEFGVKISVSAVDGCCFLDRLNWDAHNESADLIEQAKAYRDRFGCYPASIHANKFYRIRENIKFCKKHGIRLSGPALGWPPSKIEERKAAQKQVRQDELYRIPIEGKFGQGKRRFSLSKIMSKLDCTSETAIAVAFLVMNFEK